MLTVRALIDHFYQFNLSQRAPRTAEFYQGRLQGLARDLGDLAAADLRPMDAKIRAHVVRLISKNGDPSNTIESLREILAKQPKNVLARQQLGRLLIERGDRPVRDHAPGDENVEFHIQRARIASLTWPSSSTALSAITSPAGLR